MPSFQLSILSNNSSRTGYSHEFGFSVHIRTEDEQSWLWDTGQSGTFIDNASLMGVNLRSLDGIALSHGHYDHVGGLRRFFSKYNDFKGRVISHANAGIARYSIAQGKKTRSIGPQGADTPWPPPSWEPTTGHVALAAGLTFVTDIPRAPGRHQSVASFFLDSLGAKPDAVPDDAFLLLDGTRGPAVLLGCCHAGLANTLAHASRLAGSDSIHTIIGGMHLMDADEKVLEQSLNALKRHQVQTILPAHCTGDDSIAYLIRKLPGQVQEIKAGDKLEL